MYEMLIYHLTFAKIWLFKELLIGSVFHQGITRAAPAALALPQNPICHQFPNIP